MRRHESDHCSNSCKGKKKCCHCVTKACKGRKGAQGAQGAQGFMGIQGPMGERGSQGLVGQQGLVGAQGFVGDQGAQGDRGAQGFVGDQGAQGDRGAQGFVGEQGAQGDRGAQGFAGTQGAQGFTGPQGLLGPQGSQGTQGGTGGVSCLEVCETKTESTTSKSPVLLSAMSITPPEGKYLAVFGSVFMNNTSSTVNTIQIYVGGVLISCSERRFRANTSAMACMYTQAVVEVNGSQDVSVYFFTSSGTCWVYNRSLALVLVI